jgi:HAMP domain-containing protein
MLRNLKLGTRFNLLLLLVFICGVSISGVALSTMLQRKAQAEVASKAMTLMQTMTAVRNYTNTHINPLLAPRLETESVFIPETVPAYAATEVFENLRRNEGYNNFFYKEATLNPTNLRDKADTFETTIVEHFRQESGTKEISDFRSIPSGRVFYIARPLAITKESCLRCHSTPEAAPKSQLATYGKENGFGWKLNEIVAAQIISVPAEEVFASAKQSLSLAIGILISIFAVVILIINFLLKQTVIQPIKKISHLAKEVSTGKITDDFEQTSNDEIGILAASFNRMKSSLEIAMKMLNS